MALSIGKKKKEAAATDWSEDALLDDAPPAEVAPVVAPVVDAPVEDTPFDDAAGAAKKKPLLKIALAALLLLGLGGGAAYFMMGSVPEEEEAPPVVVRKRKPPKPDKPIKVVKGKPGDVSSPEVKTKLVKPGDRGIAPEGAKAPIIKSPNVQPPRIVPGPAVPTPVHPPEGMAGTPGKPGSRNVQLVPVGGAMVVPSENQTQLDMLWKRGADAKHRGDYGAARQAWQELLKLSPGHPGIQAAIDKLPK